MFGYILPRKDKLSENAAERYRGAYCGLCNCLKEHYGFRGRFLVNYDMTFLYFLLRTGQPGALGRCSCPARPFCKKTCMETDPVLEYAAHLSVLFFYWKLHDTALDGGFVKRWAAKLGQRFYRRAYRRAAKELPELDMQFSERLEHLQKLEEANCPSFDRAADAFAQLLCACAEKAEHPEHRAVGQVLYHVGRYLYLVDALEDLPKDVKKGNYNPLRYRYSLDNDTLHASDKAQLLDTMEASISLAASAFELLSPRPDEEIIRNVIYYGLSAVLNAVAEGTFRKRSKK